MEPLLAKHIEIDAARCGGKPCVTGTRIRVYDIYVWHELERKSPEEIVSDHPQLALADVHAALAYYWDNREAIQQEMKEAGDFVEQLKAKTGPGPLQRKLGSSDTDSASVPS